MIEVPPDLADGGYWYAVTPEQLAAGVLGHVYVAWSCTVDGVEWAVARLAAPVLGVPPASIGPAEALEAAGHTETPWGRTYG